MGTVSIGTASVSRDNDEVIKLAKLYICGECGGHRVEERVYRTWNPLTQEYSETVDNYSYCFSCERDDTGKYYQVRDLPRENLMPWLIANGYKGD